MKQSDILKKPPKQMNNITKTVKPAEKRQFISNGIDTFFKLM